MDLPALWREQQHATFPASCLGMSIDGRALVRIDASAGAILTAVLRSDGVPRAIDAARRATLEHDRGQAARALAELDLDAAGRAYFGRLVALADAILTA